MTDSVASESVQFYPVVHLLTGPPGLTRNGGVWKQLKSGLAKVSDNSSLMVQALHFVSYNLSKTSWASWFEPHAESTRLRQELRSVFGPSPDVFVDSGGFQLLHTDKIDLSRWGIRVDREDVLGLQLRYQPRKVSSLDFPIPPLASSFDLRRLSRKSLKNAVWLAENIRSYSTKAQPFLAVHGRRPDEVIAYAEKLEAQLPLGCLRHDEVGLALGSQVPLTRHPSSIVANVVALIRWMSEHTSEGTPLHVFGGGDGIVAGALSAHPNCRPLSYDNSTYIQNAFRLRVYNSQLLGYEEFVPGKLEGCGCAGCARLERLGQSLVSHILSSPPYTIVEDRGEKVSRSDVIGSIALHNLYTWRLRFREARRVQPSSGPAVERTPTVTRSAPYSFPLAGFHRRAPNLLLLACSRSKPYGASPSHLRVKRHLREHGFRESSEFDRITLSGLYGPVHWRDESDPRIVGYDFKLDSTVRESHRQFLRTRTGTVLGMLHRRYESIVAFLRPGTYRDVFGPIIEAHSANLVSDIHQICGSFS